jgi:hypothetical protein
MTGSTTSTLQEYGTEQTPVDAAEPAHPLVEVGQQAADSAGHLAGRAADIGLTQADRGRTMAADGLQNVANSIRRVSLDMSTDQPAIANVADAAAEQAERVATYLRQNDARQIVSNVEQVARRQPLLFLGGALVVGVALSRFIKAATSDETNAPAAQPSTSAGLYQPTGPGAAGLHEGI